MSRGMVILPREVSQQRRSGLGLLAGIADLVDPLMDLHPAIVVAGIDQTVCIGVVGWDFADATLGWCGSKVGDSNWIRAVR
jgi:hypothetical protein